MKKLSLLLAVVLTLTVLSCASGIFAVEAPKQERIPKPTEVPEQNRTIQEPAEVPEQNRSIQESIYPLALKKVQNQHGETAQLDMNQIKIDQIHHNLDGSIIISAVLSPQTPEGNVICNARIYVQVGVLGMHVLSYKVID